MRWFSRGSHTIASVTCGVATWASQRAKAAFFQGQVFGGRRDQLEMFDELGFLSGEAPVAAALALVIHPGEQRELGMGIQAQPGDGFLRLVILRRFEDICFH